MKISDIIEIFHSVKAEKAELQSSRFPSHPVRTFRCRKRPFYKRKFFIIVFIAIMAILFYCSGISNVLAGCIENIFAGIFTGQNDLKVEWTPEKPQPIRKTGEVFPDISRSTMLSLAYEYYHTKEETTIHDLDACSDGILAELENRNLMQELFELPQNFVVKNALPSSQFCTADSIEEYDSQLTDALQDAAKSHSSSAYHRIGITALNALNLLKKNGNLSLEEYIYYAELAFFGFGNEYIVERPSEGQRVDWFYRVAQVFDYLGYAANDQNPPLRHEMYFISAAFLYLSFETLEKMGFSEKRCNLYRHNVWELELDMLYRLGAYLDRREDFFDRMRDHIAVIRKLELTDDQKNKVQEMEDKLKDWERIFNH